MSSVALLINPKTDGAVPLRSELNVVNNKLQIKCKGDNGFIIQLSLDDILSVINSDLHG